MISIDYDTAAAVVKQLYPAAQNPLLDIELETTKGLKNYRPYIVAAKFILTEYRQIVKAEEITFQYNLEQTARFLLIRQKELDVGDTIPEGQQVEDFLIQFCETCDNNSSNYLGLFII